MMRRSFAALGGLSYMKYKINSGVYDEDHVNDYYSRAYMTPQAKMRWYAQMECNATKREVVWRSMQQSLNNHKGLTPEGHGPFERELERKGIAVDKYPLTTTTGATRVREMVLLRRRALEEKSKVAMETQRSQKRRSIPSEWYDESKGPLNPKFVAAMQPQYKVNISDLPPQPVSHAVFAQKHAAARTEELADRR